MRRTSAVAASIQAVSPVFTSAGMSGPHRRHGAVIGLAGADAHHAVERDDEDLAVADLPGPRTLAEGVDRRLDERVGDRDLEADLVRQAHLHGSPAIGLDAVELTSMPLDATER